MTEVGRGKLVAFGVGDGAVFVFKHLAWLESEDEVDDYTYKGDECNKPPPAAVAGVVETAECQSEGGEE